MIVICNGKIYHPITYALIFIVIPILVLMIFTMSCLSIPNNFNDEQDETSADTFGESDKVSFYSSGIDGAGFQNVVAVDPFNPKIILSGGDVVAINRSVDSGATWQLSNGGMNGLANGVASLVFSPTIPGKVYAAVSSRGDVGGLYVSYNSGETWEILSNAPQFSAGNNKNSILPENHPRSTGNLISLDEEHNLIYVGSFKDGVYRLSDEGTVLKKIGLAGKYIRSIALDPKDSNTLYVSAYDSGVWMTENASEPAPKFVRLSKSPLYIEELKFIGNELYAAGSDGKAGKVYKVSDQGKTWTQLLNSDGNTQWISLDGYVNESNAHTIFIGSNNPAKTTAKMYECLLRSTDSGATWTSLTLDEALIHYDIYGTDADKWWLQEKNPYSMMGKNTYVASQILIDPSDRQKMYIAGRSGIWGSFNGGNDWYPMVRKMNVTVNRKVIVDPNQLGRAYAANTDWVFLYSQDYMENVTQNKPNGSDSTGYAIALDKSVFPSKVYLASGDRDINSGGEIFSNPNPAVESKWTNEGLSLLTGGKRPLDLAVWNPGRVLVRESGISIPAGGADHRILSAENARDSKGILEFFFNKTGKEAELGVAVRFSSNQKYYSITLKQSSDSQLFLGLNRILNGNNDELYNVSIGSSEKAKYFIRYEIKNINPAVFRARAWKSGNPEPSVWQMEFSDSSDAQITEPGNVGLTGGKVSSAKSGTACYVSNFYAESLPESEANDPVIVTIVENSGVWRKANGEWQNVNDKVTGEDGNKIASLTWPSGSDLIFLYDHKTGIWRSNDKGASWRQIWKKPTKNKNTGYVTADPINPGKLFVSSQDGIYRIDGADTGTVESGEIIPVQLGGVPTPGPITLDELGNLYLVSLSPSLTTPGRLYKSADSGETWEDISDDYYRNNAAVPSAVAAAIDGYVYLSFTGSGVIVGK